MHSQTLAAAARTDSNDCRSQSIAKIAVGFPGVVDAEAVSASFDSDALASRALVLGRLSKKTAEAPFVTAAAAAW